MSDRKAVAGASEDVDVKLCVTAAFKGGRDELRADYQSFDQAASKGTAVESYGEEFPTRTVAEMLKGT